MRFENDVKTYGTQAITGKVNHFIMFENDVKTYGTQAVNIVQNYEQKFENDVKTYGTQAGSTNADEYISLRMM